jgi:RimJ/RimL family protein N-acetyltransferase
MRAETTPEHFHLSLAVIADGAVVGVSSLGGDDYASVRQFTTGSWLGIAHQGHGLGRELREATLHLGFAGFDAVRAHSGAFADNERSNRVSRRLGYHENGRQWMKRRGEPAEQVLYVMDRETWESQRRDDITIEGVEPVRAFLGID